MPPTKHAVLSASSSHRWLNCNPSARLEQEFADHETVAAAEGTAAHALAEHKLRKALKLRSEKPVSVYDCDEMDGYTDDYVEFVLEVLEEAKQQCKDPMVLIEQRLDFSCYVPDGFGTGDCLIVADKLLHIIDFKYGQGVLVEAEQNPQMMLYALGALRIFDHVKARFLIAYNTLFADRDHLLEDGRIMQDTLTNCDAIDAELAALDDELSVIAGMMRKCIDENARSALDQGDYLERYSSLAKRHETTYAKYRALEVKREERLNQASQIGGFLFELMERPLPLEKFDDRLWLVTIDKVIAYPDGHLGFQFRNGMEIPGRFKF